MCIPHDLSCLVLRSPLRQERVSLKSKSLVLQLLSELVTRIALKVGSCNLLKALEYFIAN